MGVCVNIEARSSTNELFYTEARGDEEIRLKLSAQIVAVHYQGQKINDN